MTHISVNSNLTTLIQIWENLSLRGKTCGRWLGIRFLSGPVAFLGSWPCRRDRWQLGKCSGIFVQRFFSLCVGRFLGMFLYCLAHWPFLETCRSDKYQLDKLWGIFWISVFQTVGMWVVLLSSFFPSGQVTFLEHMQKW